MRSTNSGHLSRTAAGLGGVCAVAILLSSCTGRSPADEEAAKKRRGDALLLARAPAFVPEELEASLDAMGIKRLYVAAATLAKDGRVVPLPPPPARLRRPVVVTVMGEEDAASQLSGARGELVGAIWAKGISKVLSDARSWGTVVGLHIHIAPTEAQAGPLAVAIRSLRAAIGNVPVSVTLPPDVSPASWKPLVGLVDEALVFSFGRRPEMGGQLVPDFPEEAARAMPLPFRVLLATGGYGRTGDGASWNGKRVLDGKVDELSEDRSLDFHFGQVLSSEPGSLYTFRPREGSSTAGDMRYVRFQLLSAGDAARFLGAVSRWAVPQFSGRVFLLEGVPSDGHLVGFGAVKALLTGKSLDPDMDLATSPGASGPGWVEFSLTAAYTAPAPTDLSHYDNWVELRLEGGVFQSVRAGEFDRFELLTSEADGSKPATFSRAVVCRLHDNFFAPGEIKQAGPFRMTSGHARAFVSFRLGTPDGKTVKSAEVEIRLPTETRPPPPRRSGR